MRSASSTEYWLAGKLMYSARGRASCWTETDSERRATNRALGVDDEEETADDEEEEEARTTARDRQKAAWTGGGERRDAAIALVCDCCRVRGPRRSPVSGCARLRPARDRA